MKNLMPVHFILNYLLWVITFIGFLCFFLESKYEGSWKSCGKMCCETLHGFLQVLHHNKLLLIPFFKKRFNYLNGGVTGRNSWWFIPQVTIMAGTRPGWSQIPETLSRTSIWVARPKYLGHLLLLSQAH